SRRGSHRRSKGSSSWWRGPTSREPRPSGRVAISPVMCSIPISCPGPVSTTRERDRRNSTRRMTTEEAQAEPILPCRKGSRYGPLHARSSLESYGLQRPAIALQPGLAAVGIGTKLPAQLPELRSVVHLLQVRHFVRHQIVDDLRWRHHDPPREGENALRSAGAPAARRILVADRLRPPPHCSRVPCHQRFDFAPGLPLQEICEA